MHPTEKLIRDTYARTNVTRRPEAGAIYFLPVRPPIPAVAALPPYPSPPTAMTRFQKVRVEELRVYAVHRGEEARWVDVYAELDGFKIRVATNCPDPYLRAYVQDLEKRPVTRG